MTFDLALACLSGGIWLYLAFGRGRFWLFRDRLERLPQTPDPKAWPGVVAVVPARNEADVIAQSTLGLCGQGYQGEMQVILVDDDSCDGTGEHASAAAIAAGAGNRHRVIRGKPLPAGWTGKLFAVSQGVAASQAASPAAKYLLLTDADIRLQPGVVEDLVRCAEAGDRVLVSVMATLCCGCPAERLLVPPFVYFFAMLYPFPWANDPKRTTAAAAGGCMLIERSTLDRAGGIAAIRDALIDDCTLAELLKPHGATWLGLSDRVESLRPYPTVRAFGKMVARSAYTQLRHSPLALVGTVAGMLITYAMPVWLALASSGMAQILGMATCGVMAASFVPILAFYKLSPVRALLLPVAALCYLGFTMQSAIAHWLGKGGMWKGRVQGNAGKFHA